MEKKLKTISLKSDCFYWDYQLYDNNFYLIQEFPNGRVSKTKEIVNISKVTDIQEGDNEITVYYE